MVKKHFLLRFQKRFLLRFHMSLILSATCLSGVLFSKLLYHLEVRDVLIRYPLTACLAYLLFFVYIKLWLHYVSSSASATAVKSSDDSSRKIKEESTDLSGAFPDITFNTSCDSVGAAPEVFSGGGGRFGGGGASASFGDAGGTAADLAKGAGKAAGDCGGFDLPDLGDDSLAFLALGLLLAAVLGAGIFLVYSAPSILSEAAFEFMLAGGLIRHSKMMDSPDWVDSVLRTTWKPFALVLAVTLAVAWFLHVHYPEMHRVADLFAE